MPRPRVYKTQAIVLRQRKLGEADSLGKAAMGPSKAL
jgi:hypothetical protein